MELMNWLRGLGNDSAVAKPVESLGERLAKGDQPFPWGLLSPEETEAVQSEIIGTLRVTTGGVTLSPWQCQGLSEQRVEELVRDAKGIGRTSNGLSDLDPALWTP